MCRALSCTKRLLPINAAEESAWDARKMALWGGGQEAGHGAESEWTKTSIPMVDKIRKPKQGGGDKARAFLSAVRVDKNRWTKIGNPTSSLSA